jgi:hypothetical protein
MAATVVMVLKVVPTNPALRVATVAPPGLMSVCAWHSPTAPSKSRVNTFFTIFNVLKRNYLIEIIHGSESILIATLNRHKCSLF